MMLYHLESEPWVISSYEIFCAVCACYSRTRNLYFAVGMTRGGLQSVVILMPAFSTSLKTVSFIAKSRPIHNGRSHRMIRFQFLDHHRLVDLLLSISYMASKWKQIHVSHIYKLNTLHFVYHYVICIVSLISYCIQVRWISSYFEWTHLALLMVSLSVILFTFISSL